MSIEQMLKNWIPKVKVDSGVGWGKIKKMSKTQWGGRDRLLIRQNSASKRVDHRWWHSLFHVIRVWRHLMSESDNKQIINWNEKDFRRLQM